MRRVDEKELAIRFDAYILRILKYTLFVTLLTGAICYFAAIKLVWILIILQLGLMTCAVFVLIKGGLTGKRYAQGAKTRRNKWLPNRLCNQNDGLEDEAFRYLLRTKK